MQKKRLHSWRDWYSFARETLGYGSSEATEYANLRYAEELTQTPRAGAVRGACASRVVFSLARGCSSGPVPRPRKRDVRGRRTVRVNRYVTRPDAGATGGCCLDKVISR